MKELKENVPNRAHDGLGNDPRKSKQHLYSPEDYAYLEPIFDKIRKYNAIGIIKQCMLVSHFAELNPKERYDFWQPWRFLLIKWSILHGDYANTRPFNYENLASLCNEIQDVEGKTLPNMEEYGEKEWFLNLRRLSFQQRPFQQDIKWSISRIARQSLIFGALYEGPRHADRNSSHYDRIQNQFVNQFKMNVNDMIELMVMLILGIEHTGPYINKWPTGFSKYPPEMTERFIRGLSFDFWSAKDFLKRRHDEYPPELRYDLIEMTPLKCYPIFNFDKWNLLYSRQLLYRACDDYIYDQLKQPNPNTFGPDFGPIFERYVGRAVEFSGLPYLNEYELKSGLGKGKAVDYAIFDDETAILIDAKGVEMTYIGEVTERIEVILQRASEVIKGIRQAYETAKRLDGCSRIKDISLSSGGQRYLLIVTYKDLYLGSGRNFYAYLAKDLLDKMVQEFEGRRWIPFEHMYFISVEDFEFLMRAVHDKKIGLSECLAKAVQVDSEYFDQKLTFYQHLTAFVDEIHLPHYAIEEVSNIGKRLKKRIEP